MFNRHNIFHPITIKRVRALFTRTIKKKKKKEKHAFTRFKDRPLSVVRLLRYSYVSSQYARPYPKYKRGARNLSLFPFPPSPIGVATVILPPSWFKINKRSRANGPKIPASGTAAGDVYPGRKWILEPDFRDRVRTTISPRKEPPSRGRERGKGREGSMLSTACPRPSPSSIQSRPDVRSENPIPGGDPPFHRIEHP